jgi:pimeloyl-ACP methyl ester carboxylesterase
VCLHPSPTTGEMFQDLQSELATSRVVHCPDTPGFGASDAPPAQPTIADYGGALGDAFVSLGHGDSQSPRGQIDLFGFHTGSLIAVEFALQFPQMVRRLIPGVRLLEMLDLPIFGFIVAPTRVAQTLRDFLDNGS